MHSISNQTCRIIGQIRAGSDDTVQVNRIPAGTPVFGGPVCGWVGVEGAGGCCKVASGCTILGVG